MLTILLKTQIESIWISRWFELRKKNFKFLFFYEKKNFDKQVCKS